MYVSSKGTVLSVVAVLAAFVGCGDATSPPTAPAPQPLPATALRPLGSSFQLVDDPQLSTRPPETYKVTYMSGSVTLQDKPRVVIGFRIDPAHPDDESELLKSNVERAKAKGFSTVPTSAGGGVGVSFVDVATGPGAVNQYRSVVAKATATVTINVDADPSSGGGDQAAKALHDKLLGSMSFRSEGLEAEWPGTATAPQVPISVDVPGEIAKDSYQSALSSYYLELRWGNEVSKLGMTWQDKATAADDFASIRADLDKAGVKHQSDVRTLPALRDSLGTRVDEGFSFNLVGADKLPRFVGVVWRKDGVIVRSTSNVGDIPISSFTEDTTAALATPMAIAKSWAWSA